VGNTQLLGFSSLISFFFLATFMFLCTLYFKNGPVHRFLDKYPNVFSVMITMKLSIYEWPQYDHHDDTFPLVTLSNFWGLIDMKILYLALSPQLQMHIYLP